MRRTFNSADFVADSRVVFNVAGNRYRLVCRIAYPFKQVLVKFVGTHAEYDKIDAATVQPDVREQGGAFEAPLRLLRTEADYEAALVEYEAYSDNEPAVGSIEGDRFELLGMVITRYEDEHYPIPHSDPVELIRFVMEQRGFTQVDLATLLGSRSRASEILNGRRSLTLDHIRKLHREWGIPAESLLGDLRAAS